MCNNHNFFREIREFYSMIIRLGTCHMHRCLQTGTAPLPGFSNEESGEIPGKMKNKTYQRIGNTLLGSGVMRHKKSIPCMETETDGYSLQLIFYQQDLVIGSDERM